jgi:RNA polymerase sigma-70 factor (ECF subfamily)
MHRRPSDDASGDWAGGLYDRFAAGMYRYALMILASPDDAADVVQEVFVSMLRSGKQQIGCDEAYLRRAVRNACYTVLRKRRRDAPWVADAPLLEAIVAADDRPYERLAIEQAIRVLPPEQREVIHLKVFCGMTFQEIATVVDESINTVASRYRYAIEKLRNELGAAMGHNDAR